VGEEAEICGGEAERRMGDVSVFMRELKQRFRDLVQPRAQE
jgi:hypothetical protein